MSKGTLKSTQAACFAYLARRAALGDHEFQVQDIRAALNLRSRAHAHWLLSELERKGLIRREPRRPSGHTPQVRRIEILRDVA